MAQKLVTKDYLVKQLKNFETHVIKDKYTESDDLTTHTSDTNNPHSVTKEQVGLGNVDNTADASKPVSTAQQSAIDTAYANSNAYTDQKIAGLINGAPTTLDTLGEIATAMANNEDVVEALEESIGKKASQAELDTHTGNNTIHITSSERTNWNAAKTHADSAHAPSNAEANQNAFSNVVVGSTTIAADSKTDSLTLAGSNVTLTPDATNDKVTIGITKANVVAALGYTPPQTNTTYAIANSTTAGLVKSGTDITVDANGNVSVNDDSHNHIIGNIDNLQSTLDGKWDISSNGTIIPESSDLDTYKTPGNFYCDNSTRAKTLSNCPINDSGFRLIVMYGYGSSYPIQFLFGYGNVFLYRSYANSASKWTDWVDVLYNHPTSGVTAGTYRSVTVNADGHVTAGSNPTVTVAQGGTGATTNLGAEYNVAGHSPEVTSEITDDSLSVFKYTGASATKGVYFFRKASLFWDYIKGKADSVYAKLTHSHDAATTSAAGFMSAADKTKLDKVKSKNCIVGRYNTSTTNPWFKFASVILTKANQDFNITLKVSTGFGDSGTGVGILTAHIRSNSSKVWQSGELVWEYAGNGIDVNDFVLAYKNTADTSCSVELWVKIEDAWAHKHFEVIVEHDRNYIIDNWVLYDNVSSEGESVIPTDYTQVVSKLISINNSITGNAATATALKSSAGSATQPVYFADGKPVACTNTLGKSVPSDAKFTDTTYSAAGSSLGLVKSGGDVTISDGVITVNDDSHNHTIDNIDDLQNTLNKKWEIGSIGTNIPSNADLNNYTTPGNYYSENSTKSKTITNTPITSSGFSLAVLYGYQNVCVYQIAFGYGNAFKFRTKDSASTWNDWVDVLKDTTYTGANGISLSGTTFSNSGVRSISTGSSNGTISVNTNGTSANVSVKGLAAAAYKGVDTTVTSGSSNLVTSGAVYTAVSAASNQLLSWQQWRAVSEFDSLSIFPDSYSELMICIDVDSRNIVVNGIIPAYLITDTEYSYRFGYFQNGSANADSNGIGAIINISSNSIYINHIYLNGSEVTDTSKWCLLYRK